MGKPKAPLPLPPHLPVTALPLEKTVFRKLGKYLGTPLSELEKKEVEWLLGTHKWAVENISHTTPANVIAALEKAKKTRSIEKLTIPNAGIDEETHTLLKQEAGAGWEALEVIIDFRISTLRGHPKLHGSEKRALLVTANRLGMIYRVHHGLARYAPPSDVGTSAKIRPLRQASKKECLACRNFVSHALTCAGIQHPDSTKDPQRLDTLIWADLQA